MKLVETIIVFLIELPAWQSLGIVSSLLVLYLYIVNGLVALLEIKERKQAIADHKEWYREFRKTDAFRKARELRRRIRERRSAHLHA